MADNNLHCSFPKQEKLISRKLIDILFAGGRSKSLSAYPLRLVFAVLDGDDEALEVKGRATKMADAQVLVSVPKKCFKHAVDRNRVKRQVREAYRRHKDLYSLHEGRHLAMAFIWLDRNHHSTDAVEEKVKNLLRRMNEKMSDVEQ